MPKHIKKRKTLRRTTRRVKRTRRVMPRRYKGGYSPLENDKYPTVAPTSYPVGQSGALPDPSGHNAPRWF